MIFVTHLHGLSEHDAVERLSDRFDVAAFYPLVEKRVRAARRVRRTVIRRFPLFPRYLFVDNPAPHRATRNIGAVVLGTVEREIAERFRNMVIAAGTAGRGPDFPRGTRVEITAGPLEGNVGIVEDHTDAGLARIGIKFMGCIRIAQIDEDHLRAA